MRIPIISDLIDRNQGQGADMMMPAHNITFQGNPGADYPESYYRNQVQIRQVNSKQDMLDWVDSALLSSQCQQALKSLIVNLYDDNVILSYHKDELRADIAELRAKLLVSPIKANAYPSDVKNPAYAAIIAQIYYQLGLRLTRTIAKDRERIINGKVEQSYEIKNTMARDDELKRRQ